MNENNTTEENILNQPLDQVESENPNYNFSNDNQNGKEKETKKYTYKKSIAVGLAGTILCGASFGYFLGVGLNTSNSVISSINNTINGGFSFSKINNKKRIQQQQIQIIAQFLPMLHLNKIFQKQLVM